MEAMTMFDGDEASLTFGTSMAFPENAVAEGEEVLAEILLQEGMHLPDEPKSMVTLLNPVDYEFKKKVTIGLPFGHLPDVNTDDLVIVRFDPETKEIKKLTSSDLSTKTNIIYTDVTTLGYFAVSQQGIEVLDFIDVREDKTYKTVTIGDQTWMAENLDYESSGSILYNNDAANASLYGRLYSQHNAIDACPDGWHLPSDTEWAELELFLGMDADDNNKDWDRAEGIGGHLKATGTEIWQSPNEGAINSVKFSALPGGMAETSSSFIEIGKTAYFWTSTIASSGDPWYRTLYYADDYIGRLSISKSMYMSVRCVRD
jgi:uncharacterized protein (TIGR02145 family)